MCGSPWTIREGITQLEGGGGLEVTRECTPFWQPKPNWPTHPTSSVVQIENQGALYLAKYNLLGLWDLKLQNLHSCTNVLYYSIGLYVRAVWFVCRSIPEYSGLIGSLRRPARVSKSTELPIVHLCG